jgi:hypothetical protein
MFSFTCVPRVVFVYWYFPCPWHLKQRLLRESNGETNTEESFNELLSGLPHGFPFAGKKDNKNIPDRVNRKINNFMSDYQIGLESH